MNTIKFSHTYKKLEGVSSGSVVLLLQVIQVRLEDLSKAFLEYDTDNGTYKLPSYGDYLMLIFQKENEQIFTTLRPNNARKYIYYQCKQGQLFKVLIEEQK